MKNNKKLILNLLISFVMVFVVVFGFGVKNLQNANAGAPTSSDTGSQINSGVEITPGVSTTEYGYIKFSSYASYNQNYDQDNDEINDTLLLESNDTAKTVTVTYKVVYNDGINSLLLIPTYNKNVFTLAQSDIIVTVPEGWNAATITGTETETSAWKIALESNTKYEGTTAENEAFVTLTFAIVAPVDGTYGFGLYLGTTEEKNTNASSVAYVIKDGENLGEQEEVLIEMVETAAVNLLTYKDAEIEIGYNEHYDYDLDYLYTFTYSGATVGVQKVETLNNENPTSVEYTYSGTADTEDIVVKWYSGVKEYNENTEKEEMVYTEIDAPVSTGEYYVGVSAPAHGIYHAVDTVYRLVHIYARHIEIQIDNKSSAYGDSIVALTYTTSGSVLPGDNLGITLSTTATSSSNVGNYPITASYNSSAIAGKYYVDVYEGTYTINPKAITITAQDQTAEYTGSEPIVDQTKYEVTGATITSGVTITKQPGVNVGEYTLTPSYSNGNYTVTPVTATFHITSVNYGQSYFTPYFAGDTVTYDAESHDLLIVSEHPTWFSYTPSNNNQTNANNYYVGVKITLTQENANNYTNGVKEFNFTVPATINKLALTVTADNKTSEYGSSPKTLTPTTVGLNNEVEVTFTVKDNGTPFTLASDTPVGTYDIVPYASNANYTFSFENGVYEVTKAQASITVTAEDCYYNRQLDYQITEVTIPNVTNPTTTNYTITYEKYENNEWVSSTQEVKDAGTYRVVATISETNNYYGATDSATFTILPIQLAYPTNLTYNKATASWDAVTTDIGGVEVYNATIKYYIVKHLNSYNGIIIKDTTSLNASGSLVGYELSLYAKAMKLNSTSELNPNYISSETLPLNSVYSVTFTEGEHTASSATVQNLPGVQYLFAGQTAVEPEEVPTLVGYTFDGWNFTFTNAINANTNIPAIWNINQYTMTVVYVENVNNTETSKTFEVGYGTEVAVSTYNLKLQTGLTGDDDNMATEYDLAGMHYVFGDLWNYKVTGASEYTATEVHQVPVTVTNNMTFVAVYASSPIEYTIQYMLSIDGGDYAAMEATNVKADYGSNITLDTLSNKVWFNTDAWYTNVARTELAPATMPAHNLTVYGAYVFNVGQGDINGDGKVDASDITLYRQWIVGGYQMTVLKTDAELLEAAQNETASATQTRYLIMRVADNNADNSEDIRDVSITRMAIVENYTWDIETGYNVTGQEIIRNAPLKTLSAVTDAINAGRKVTLGDDITEDNGVLNIQTSKNVYLNLGGHTLTVNSLSIVSTSRSTLTIENGTIVTEDGITISAPHGNVVLNNLTGYDKYGLVNLAAANHSLHVNGLVKFYVGTDTTVEEPTPAAVNVEQGTHVVVEEESNLVVEKLVVTTENFTEKATQVTEVITIKNLSALVDEIEVEGSAQLDSTIKTYEELVAAVKKGGEYKLEADINCGDNDIVCSKSLTLDLNEYDITFSVWGFEVRSGATLTFNGNGNVTAAEAALYAQRGGHLVVNGGTYTSTENFVIGTHGSEDRGNNTITINGGTFNASMCADGQSAGYIACGIYVANNDTVVVNGGTFNVTNGVGILARSGNTTVGENVVFNVTGDETLGKVGDSQVTVPSGEELVLDLKAAYPGGVPTLNNNTSYDVYVVVDGTYTFANDDASFHAARGVYDNVILTADLSDYVYVNKNMNLYLNGHTIDASATSYVAVYVVDGAKLTINGDGNVISTEGCVMAINGSEFVINGGTYTCYDNFVFGTNGSEGLGNNHITVNAGTFNGQIKSSGYVACGIYVANNDTVVVNGGTFNVTNGVGILARSGNTTVGKNVVFNVTGNETLGKVGDSQVTVPSGEELVLDLKAGYPGGVPTLTNNSSYVVYTIENN